MQKIEGGDIDEDFGMLPPKFIDDPNVKKPSDWIDEEYIDDPESKKPSDWDDRGEIPDP